MERSHKIQLNASWYFTFLLHSPCSDTAAGTQEIEKHLTWAARERINVLDDLLVLNFAFLWSLPSRDHFCNLSAISDHVTLSEIVTETASMVTGIPEEDFTDKKLTDKLRTFATEHKVKFPQYMKFLRTVISGLKVSTVLYPCFKIILRWVKQLYV